MSCPKGAHPASDLEREPQRDRTPAAASVESRAGERDAGWDAAFAAVLAELPGDGVDGDAVPPLRCVSSGYLTGGCSCQASVPADVAEGAWRRELRGGRPEGFFRFAWQCETWLGYGLGDGSVRGVYCPEHGAERDRRVQGAGGRVLAV